ncbi:MAG: hypothetical protein AB7P33_03835 [Dehalococcoidia bacterium]
MQTSSRLRLPFLLSGALAVALLVFAVACSDDDDDDNSQQGSESAACGDITSFENAVDQVRGLSTSSSIDDISRSLTTLRTTATDLRSSLQEIKYDKTDEIQAATSDLQDALGKAVTSGSLSQAQSEINTAVNDVRSDLSDAKDKANCD